MGPHDEEINKINVSNPLKSAQRRSDWSLSFMVTVHPDQADPKCKQNIISCRSCVKLPLYIDVIDGSIDIKILEPPHILLFHLADLENGRNPDIGTLKKDRGDVFRKKM